MANKEANKSVKDRNITILISDKKRKKCEEKLSEFRIVYKANEDCYTIQRKYYETKFNWKKFRFEFDKTIFQWSNWSVKHEWYGIFSGICINETRNTLYKYIYREILNDISEQYNDEFSDNIYLTEISDNGVRMMIEDHLRSKIMFNDDENGEQLPDEELEIPNLLIKYTE